MEENSEDEFKMSFSPFSDEFLKGLLNFPLGLCVEKHYEQIKRMSQMLERNSKHGITQKSGYEDFLVKLLPTNQVMLVG